MSGDIGLFDIVALILAVAGAGEIIASRSSLIDTMPRARLVAALLFWEGIAMIAIAAVLYARQAFDAATIVAVVAIWLAATAVAALRAGAFDPPRE